ncbi:MAG: chemotaxis protein CheA [Halocynthiibacter sp.]
MAGKDVALKTIGEMTEVDKTVIEQLTDPLTHMIRNAVDHGLEDKPTRLAAGKPEVGEIVLSAAHRSGRVIIEVSDDGAGINRERVYEIAVQKKLIEPGAELSPGEIDNLLFLPGFSTASEVSSLSGRGVGMDVVKSAIRALGGRVAITSNEGVGTSFTISLPLTLAVLDGMIVEVADEAVVIPITSIVESLRPAEGDVHRVGANDFVLSVRGTMTPIIDLGHSLGFREPREAKEECVYLLIETEHQSRFAFVVDRILEQRQVVIKSLETNYRHVPGVAAATILGNGRIALIIDADMTALAARPENTLARTG